MTLEMHMTRAKSRCCRLRRRCQIFLLVAKIRRRRRHHHHHHSHNHWSPCCLHIHPHRSPVKRRTGCTGWCLPLKLTYKKLPTLSTHSRRTRARDRVRLQLLRRLPRRPHLLHLRRLLLTLLLLPPPLRLRLLLRPTTTGCAPATRL